MHAADEYAEPAAAAGDEDSVEEQNDFGALAQHRDGDHNGERDQRFRSAADLTADRMQLIAHFATVPRHPDIVPG